jgi:hypothetical protein
MYISPVQGVLATVYRNKKLKEKAASAQKRAVRPLTNESMKFYILILNFSHLMELYSVKGKVVPVLN